MGSGLQPGEEVGVDGCRPGSGVAIYSGLMKWRIAVPVLIGTAVILSGCTPGGDFAPPRGSPIFDGERTSSDTLPGGRDFGVDPETSRFVGADAAGNRYWAAYEVDSHAECVIYVSAEGDDWAGFCGGSGVSATTASGLVIEFASSPAQLTTDDAELVGDTLLVKQSN